MALTLYTFFKGSASNGDDTDPEQSSSFYNPPMTTYQNVSIYRRETVALDDGDTRTITLPNYAASGWSAVMARVIGEAKITTVGTDWNGASGVTGDTVGYGVSRYPGMISLSTTNVTSFTLEGLADSTTVEYLAMTLLTDAQL